MLIKDLLGHLEAKAYSNLPFGGEERLKDLATDRMRNAMSVVSGRDPKASLFSLIVIRD